MSDEKIDVLDKRVNELLMITGKLVEAVNLIGEQQKVFAENLRIIGEQQQKFAEEQKRLAEEQKITSGRLDDVIRVVINLDKKHEEFRQETNENFAKLREENRVTNRKVEWATTTALDADKRVEDLETRVAKLEERFAS
jgi:hypothetical protein